jgi:hypothetical protein
MDFQPILRALDGLFCSCGRNLQDISFGKSGSTEGSIKFLAASLQNNDATVTDITSFGTRQSGAASVVAESSSVKVLEAIPYANTKMINSSQYAGSELNDTNFYVMKHNAK